MRALTGPKRATASARRRRAAALLATTAVACAGAFAVPTVAGADPEPTPEQTSTANSLDALAALGPAILGMLATPVDALADQKAAVQQVREFLAGQPIPDDLRSTIDKALNFLDGSGGDAEIAIPENGPIISQFLWPTLGRDCMGPGGNSVGTALAVPEPALLPPPGVGPHQAGFVFTALGTGPATGQQNMTVEWLNIDTMSRGSVPLTAAANINPGGPTTLSGIGNTGSGHIIAMLSGGITNTPKEGAPAVSCTFLPTVGMFAVA